MSQLVTFLPHLASVLPHARAYLASALPHAQTYLASALPHSQTILAGPNGTPTTGTGGGGLIGCGDNNLNPCADAPQPVQQVANTLISWTRWVGLAGGVFGLMSCGVMMAIGRRNRSHLAGEGASGIPWVLGGLSVIALSYGIVSQVLS